MCKMCSCVVVVVCVILSDVLSDVLSSCFSTQASVSALANTVITVGGRVDIRANHNGRRQG